MRSESASNCDIGDKNAAQYESRKDPGYKKLSNGDTRKAGIKNHKDTGWDKDAEAASCSNTPHRDA